MGLVRVREDDARNVRGPFVPLVQLIQHAFAIAFQQRVDECQLLSVINEESSDFSTTFITLVNKVQGQCASGVLPL